MELARTRSSLEEEESRPGYLDPSLTILDFEARSLVQRATQQTHLEKSSGQELTQPASGEEYFATCVKTGHVVSPRGTDLAKSPLEGARRGRFTCERYSIDYTSVKSFPLERSRASKLTYIGQREKISINPMACQVCNRALFPNSSRGD